MVNVIGILISILLVIPPDIAIVADNTIDDSKLLNMDNVKAITATIELDNNNNYAKTNVIIITIIINDHYCR